MRQFIRSLGSLALGLMAGAACVAAPPDRTGELPTAAVQVSPTVASPGTWIRVDGTGFRVAEYVEIVVVDAAGSQASLGRLIADGRGDIEAEVAPADRARNGVSLIRLTGAESKRTAAFSINLTGWSDVAPTTELPQWIVKSDAETSSCQQCLLVHGQTP